MSGSKGILTPLIPDCYVPCTLAILKNIRNPLIFLWKMATYSCFWRVKRSKILLQASLHRLSDLLTLVSSYNYARKSNTMKQIHRTGSVIMYKIDFNQPCHIHFIGIGGISMSGLAEILLEEGFTVSGSDNKESALTDHLSQNGACLLYTSRCV